MTCRNCGTTIADKAIVCFRCGTPTDLPAVPAKRLRLRDPLWLTIVRRFVLVFLLLAGFSFVPGIPRQLHSPDATVGGFLRLAGVAVVAVVISDVVGRVLRRRPPRPPV